MKDNDYSSWFLLSDLDGTLINSQGETSAENKEAISYFQAHGGLFAISTGRSQHCLSHYLDGIETSGPSVLYNGGAVYDLQNRKYLVKNPLDQQAALPVIEMVLRDYPNVVMELYTSEMLHVLSGDRIADPAIDREHFDIRYSRAEDLLNEEWPKAMLCCEDADLLDEAARGVAADGGNKRFELFYSGAIYFEILNHGISKGSALSQIAAMPAYQGRRFAAVGDHDNDAYMLRAADFGIAVANASQRCFKAAGAVSADNDHHALADVIYNILPNAR